MRQAAPKTRAPFMGLQAALRGLVLTLCSPKNNQYSTKTTII